MTRGTRKPGANIPTRCSWIASAASPAVRPADSPRIGPAVISASIVSAATTAAAVPEQQHGLAPEHPVRAGCRSRVRRRGPGGRAGGAGDAEAGVPGRGAEAQHGDEQVGGDVRRRG